MQNNYLVYLLVKCYSYTLIIKHYISLYIKFQKYCQLWQYIKLIFLMKLENFSDAQFMPWLSIQSVWFTCTCRWDKNKCVSPINCVGLYWPSPTGISLASPRYCERAWSILRACSHATLNTSRYLATCCVSTTVNTTQKATLRLFHMLMHVK